MMIIENLELIVFAAALFFSRDKLIPLLLISCNLFFQFSDAYLMGKYYGYVTQCEIGSLPYDYCDGYLMGFYAYQAFILIVMAIMFYVLNAKIAILTSIVLSVQAITFVIMVPIIYHFNKTYDVQEWVFDLHSSANSMFVIIYCVVAWMCVYYSRKSKL